MSKTMNVTISCLLNPGH